MLWFSGFFSFKVYSNFFVLHNIWSYFNFRALLNIVSWEMVAFGKKLKETQIQEWQGYVLLVPFNGKYTNAKWNLCFLFVLLI